MEKAAPFAEFYLIHAHYWPAMLSQLRITFEDIGTFLEPGPVVRQFENAWHAVILGYDHTYLVMTSHLMEIRKHFAFVATHFWCYLNSGLLSEMFLANSPAFKAAQVAVDAAVDKFLPAGYRKKIVKENEKAHVAKALHPNGRRRSDSSSSSESDDEKETGTAVAPTAIVTDGGKTKSHNRHKKAKQAKRHVPPGHGKHQVHRRHAMNRFQKGKGQQPQQQQQHPQQPSQRQQQHSPSKSQTTHASTPSRNSGQSSPGHHRQENDRSPLRGKPGSDGRSSPVQYADAGTSPKNRRRR
jgi:hypothetical protein